MRGSAEAAVHYGLSRFAIAKIPIDSESYNAIICVHVLEHVENDRRAIGELFRVLKPDGWALITVPIDFTGETYEDPAIVEPGERKKHFGEEQHVRIYGFDFPERLQACGFQVLLDRGEDVPLEMEK